LAVAFCINISKKIGGIIKSTARKIQSPEDKGALEKANVAMVQTNRNKK
jgi:hypothetical protein